MVWHVARVLRDNSTMHSRLNDILRPAFKTAQIPAVKEPVGLTREDGKRPDGVTLIPWTRGMPLTRDVTVPDTFADSHLVDTATGDHMAGAAADKAASTKEAKYRQLANSDAFVPVAVETVGTCTNHLAVELTQELGRKVSAVTEDSRETGFLFQHFHHRINVGHTVFTVGFALMGYNNNNNNNYRVQDAAHYLRRRD